MTGITRSAAAKIIAEHFGTSAVHVGGTYDTYTVEDDTGRKWKVVSDASIQCQSRGERTASRLYAVEVVSPICKYEDIETIQQLVRELRRGGAKVNDSCGIHIHVDASRHDPKTLRNIVNIMASKEDLLYKALRVQIDREYYCQKADLRFLEDVNLKRPKSMSEFETLWYHGSSRRGVHYDSTRVIPPMGRYRNSSSQMAVGATMVSSTSAFLFLSRKLQSDAILRGSGSDLRRMIPPPIYSI